MLHYLILKKIKTLHYIVFDALKACHYIHAEGFKHCGHKNDDEQHGGGVNHNGEQLFELEFTCDLDLFNYCLGLDDIADKNVLPFRYEYVGRVDLRDDVKDEKVKSKVTWVGAFFN